ncbi:hypothetical protein DFH06DRAFT_1439214 [Mycena polygramma]|nr:hypothetical protein DFH06DRAFT_1439214 [Mycena polygramma]
MADAKKRQSDAVTRSCLASRLSRNDESTVTILPCSLAELWNIGDKMSNNNGRCNVCGASATLKCARCKLFYCNKSCQLKDWKGNHKTECKVVQQIVKWEALNWDTVEEANLVEI